MKVFISWSGERSKRVASALREWLPRVIQSAQPWMSEEDITKGTPWFEAIQRALDDSPVGIFVVTAENLGNPWLNYEAGAMSQLLKSQRACPFLVGMNKGDLAPPLSSLNLTSGSDYDDVLRLVRTIKPETVTEAVIEHAFEQNWEYLSKAIQSQIDAGPPQGFGIEGRSDSDKLDEVLDILRAQTRAGKNRARGVRNGRVHAAGGLLPEDGGDALARKIRVVMHEEGVDEYRWRIDERNCLLLVADKDLRVEALDSVQLEARGWGVESMMFDPDPDQIGF